MVSSGALASFAGLALLLVLVPGPSVLFTIGRALTAGRRTALLNVVGNAVGVYLQVVAVAFGVGAVVTASATVFTAIKLIGAGYLVYLGIQSFRHRTQLRDALAIEPDGRDRRAIAALRDGFVVGLANPKTIVFLAALLPQFVDPTRGAVAQQMLILGLCIPLFGLIFDSLWAVAAGSARSWFARSPRRLAAVGGTGGLVMIGLGASLALTGRKD
ncbi:LysE family translocator [Nocardia caishijiensis]|uniref:Threonine/homoserine/homoserine lactone efflux protein n=1 Tax=Nocardia caishijiensis TaxID=184756 RepID=A0ABQ6YQ46_9NOCA|nr:LysE family translocator [Nocardia caishijiensis]KAF0847773.1 threonine/homoserine/homoserine lactone efflux protein [Nocardia caishijiensis]